MDIDKVLCIIGRLMPLAMLIPRIMQDLVAIAVQLRAHPDPKVQAMGQAIHDPEMLKNSQTHL